LNNLVSAIVDHPETDGGVVVVAGNSYEDPSTLSSLFRLRSAQAEWETLPQALKKGRFGHVAFGVPDDAVECT
jgi:hypothetical protein